MSHRVSGLRYAALTATDFEAERTFLTDVWKLTEAVRKGDVVHLAAEGSAEPFVIRLRRAEESGLELIAFASASAADVDALHAELSAKGVKIISAPAPLDSPGGGYGFRFFDLDGHTLEVSSDVAPRTPRELKAGESIPATLSHVVLHTPDMQKSEAWYRDMLGFRTSDWLGDFMLFMRCSHVHHSIAFIPGPPTLNHIAFEMRDMSEMMRAIGRLHKEGVGVKWGPGRHTAGNNTFAYFKTPNGHNVEYTAELDRVTEDWTPTRYEMRPDIADQWGTSMIATSPANLGPPRADPFIWRAPPL